MELCYAKRSQSKEIARLIMSAMSEDCCRWFAGPDHTLADFERMMTTLVEREDSQYSYKNTLVALTEDQVLAGILVSYDGADLLPLRRAFIEEAKTFLQRDFSDMDEETQAGELYLDSLAVLPAYRGQGIATRLLKESVKRAQACGLPAVGLLVDCGNPNAEKLYTNVGFRFVNDAMWGGHPMRHLQYPVTNH
ncbi:GNAT family N-acetyltransferase [Prevotella sp. Rep29]|uniref:GNAT family N-acetyltransferase n=1 Tax=Prevotella sp. Rep29 TaxID=2691580 RepID=UPI001C6DFF88|nr:GNAT family N-acetyltransferase [Prevotella sp. Rep29]QYR09893.1 GNAT family N-acetyltransferase [Prevotella sp. Rep29]